VVVLLGELLYVELEEFWGEFAAEVEEIVHHVDV
jgi:hypothetical protein